MRLQQPNMTELLTTIMSFGGVQRQSSQEDGSADGAQRKKISLWYRRSLRGSNSGHGQNTKSLPRPNKPKQTCKQLVDYANPQRTTVSLEKQDNETFGFELQTYGVQLRHSSAVEMCTFVLTVEEEGAAEAAGLTAGDVVVSINGTSIEGSSRQRVLDLMTESNNTLKLETVYGSVVKRIELQKRLNVLKQSLSEKLLQLQSLSARESQLTGNMNDGNPQLMNDLLDDKRRLGRRSSSCSSYRSAMTDDSDLNSVFGDLNSPFSAASTSDDGCFFSRDFQAGFNHHHHHRSLSHSSSSSAASSSSPSPTAYEVRTTSLFGTLPRKGRKTSMRKNIFKFLPGLQRSVEEE